MPIYTFVSEGGEVVEDIVPPKTTRITRDGVDYKRCIANEGFTVANQVKTPSQAEQVKGGYYKLECDEGSRFQRQSQFTTKQIKKAWGF